VAAADANRRRYALRVNRRPQLTIVAPSASPEEAAAVVAALERFMRETAPAAVEAAPAVDAWTRTALLEGVGREQDALGGWSDPHPWGR
jgi:hypothetical protein